MYKKLLIALLLATTMLFAAALPSVATDVYDFTYYDNDDNELLRIEKHTDKVKRVGDTLYLKTETNAHGP